MNIKVLILLLTILSVIIIGCVTSDKAVTLTDNTQTTIKLVKTEMTDNVKFRVFHDDEYKVTCYHINDMFYVGEAASCVPDSLLNRGN